MLRTQNQRRVSENSKLEMWSSKSNLDLNGAQTINGGNEIRLKRSEVSFSSRVMAEAADKLNNDLKI